MSHSEGNVKITFTKKNLKEQQNIMYLCACFVIDRDRLMETSGTEYFIYQEPLNVSKT